MYDTVEESEIPVQHTMTWRFVVYKEQGFWLSHCLETDVVAEGASAAEALRNSRDLCDFQIRTAMRDGDIASIFRPAPKEIWLLFMNAKKTSKPIKALSRHRDKASSNVKPVVDQIEAREYELV